MTGHTKLTRNGVLLTSLIEPKASRSPDLRYAQDLFLRVRDNSIGIEPAVAEGGKDGHFGLNGMRERADRIGAKLTLVSSGGSGTEISVIVPSGIVFRRANAVSCDCDG
jgi:glucose-6-phosphate-specific signal transduction histidine kinase